jgi:proline iminopeptidase
MKTARFGKLILIIFISILFCKCSQNNETAQEMNLWPEIEPFQTNYLKVSEIHEIYYELSGNSKGRPVFVIHGGPGVGTSPYMRRFFDPDKFLIILHDQRGCGKSRPNAELSGNTTQNLVADIEQLRIKLNLDKIILFGGSWGSTLSLAYAETYPENVSGMVLRGIWFATKEEEDNFMKGIPKFFPEMYESFIDELPDTVSTPPIVNTILSLIQSKNPSDQKKYSKLISRYEYKACGLHIRDDALDAYYNDENNMNEIYTNALLECFYSSNGCFLEEGQLMKNINKIQHIPTIIVNGRYDMVCPPITAYKLHKRLDDSKLIIVEGAGHLMSEKPIEIELLKAMREFE